MTLTNSYLVESGTKVIGPLFHIDTMTICSVPQDWNDSTGFMECTVPVPILMRNHCFTHGRDLVIIVIYHLGGC
jgi:hypothetical protein